MFEGILGYIIGGAVIGILARFFKPGADPIGWIMTLLLGIVGAVAGGYLSSMLGIGSRWLVWVIAILAFVWLVPPDWLRDPTATGMGLLAFLR